ncbi:ATP-binding domain-containing protein, partial [Ruminococcaceae bacterium OttesenSCG-928-L11]|nr:ATP-binding domain-containing protein [Ruminococcaceae bacterium OttesenSCG-928-L11]
KCQAIYDYDCLQGTSVSSVEFYKRLDMLLPEDVFRYELTGNKRQADSLARISDDMRCALLEFDEPADVNSLIENELRNINIVGNIERFDFSHITKRTAILCRNNGEAEYISHMLHKNCVQHNLLRSVRQVPTWNRWIADCFWDYQADSRMPKDAFIARYCGRVANDEDKAAQCYEALCDLVYGDEKPFIETEKLSAALCKPMAKKSKLLLNPEEFLLTVSTIHKAKGREFDCVYLLDNGSLPNAANTEEARVWYVGCTRAKMELNKLKKKKQYLRKSNTNQARWAGLGYHKARWGNNHCSNLVVGLPEDVLATGFVAGNLDKAVELQEYISEAVSVGEECQLILTDSVYHVQHKGRIIGSLASSLYNEFWSIAKENIKTSNPPSFLSPVFITNIITVTPDRFPDNVSTYFRATKFWLGIELSGFPKIDWNYEKPQSVTGSDWMPGPYSDWDTIK